MEQDKETSGTTGTPVEVNAIVSLISKGELETAIKHGVDRFVTPYFLGFAIIFFALWVFGKTPWLRDDTDPAGGQKRPRS